MKKLLLSALVALALSGCSANVRPNALRGQYPDKPYVVSTPKGYDEVWDRLLDVMAVQRFPIKLIDRENGILVTERSPLTFEYTFEDKKGVLLDPYAYLVLPTASGSAFSQYFPGTVTGVVTVRIKAIGNQTYINANLSSIQIYDTGLNNEQERLLWTNARSTGNFEKFIVDEIK